ncbi:Protein of unknown function (DUF2867) [Streptoalloteichus tenebrarius]|uniref:DUF2867 domain-containing protein n=1 Tax=Streptoalloteichus tenebrarius (strain ATCC 17920 / DSM 40477 / JCM 4838 / CBS 697.72 / NBRC 16177 / NCIMB 11028 / NRRL B-12390 / A12253. 1 / ISP 5477) TaxID=1933 RepID=A0ABT1HQ76_STRSD|nr:hypothetical protein [Streptoalloteichus tenebrarius]MCP2257671.1 Protein of unknown function (DUF2867) [Streptoalloteichus tenebrarius]BFE98632.1 hypothetical protein GCM10020241_03080 [Streptoalloteichus tenebrarius]
MVDSVSPAPTTDLARETAVPPALRELSELSQIDYENTVIADTVLAPNLTAEQWAREVLEGAPAEQRDLLTGGWTNLGLRLTRERSDDVVLGWSVRRRTPDHLVLAVSSDDGLEGELVIERRQHAVLFASFIRHSSDEARARWKRVEPMHTPAMCQLLGQGVHRVASA